MSETRDHIYLPIQTKTPISLNSRDTKSQALRAALSDFSHALSSICINYHHGDTQHLVMPGSYSSLGSGSISSRLNSQASSTSSELHNLARTFQRRIRSCNGIELNVRVKRMSKPDQRALQDLCDLAQMEVKLEGGFGLTGPYTAVKANGPVANIMRVHQFILEHRIKKYQLNVY